MTASRHPQINQELLSAYLDNEVTDEERIFIEAAITRDPAIAWEVESLRQTVRFIQALPPVALPRSFTLEAVLAEAKQPVAVSARMPVVASQRAEPHWWQWLLQLWQGGNLQLRNAAAVAFALLLVFWASDQLILPTVARPQASYPALSRAVTEETIAVQTVAIPTTLDATDAATGATGSVGSAETPKTVIEETVAVAENAGDAPTAKQPSAVAPPTLVQPSVHVPGEDTDVLTGNRFDDRAAPSTMAPAASSYLESQAAGDAALKSNQGPVAGVGDAATQETAVTAASVLTATNPITVSELEITPANPVTATVAIPIVEATVVATLGVTATAELTDTPTAAPIASPLPVAELAEEEQAAEPVAITQTGERWLGWAQILTAFCTVVLGLLWWRSRG
ncbi:MAG: hypothetical protein KF832_22550 [Caldilineaceae bacterium]|nr:hypothetical protein [Caldilineaceae bacterium]